MLALTVRGAGRRFGDLPAFVGPDGTVLTFRGLDERSDAVAAGLAARGVGEGDRVALRLPSGLAYVVAYAAAAKLGALTAGINPRLAPPEQEALVALAAPATTLADEAAVGELAVIGRRRLDRHEAPPTPAPDADRPVALVFTSGTTGRPKGAVFAGRQLRAVAEADTGGGWADGPGPAALAATQFAHVGFMTKLPWYLRRGLRTHVLGRWRADDALRVVAEQAMPSVGAVAPQLALMVRSPEAARHDWARLRTVVAGGAASPPALVDEVRRTFGVAYAVRWSSTESGGCGTGTAPDADDEELHHTVGRPRGGVEVEVRGDDGGRAPDGTVGQLWVRSPTQMVGYWRDPEATAATIVGGWVRTGDLARIDGRGLVRLAGRSDDVYVRGGYNVHPAEVEAHLGAHPDLADAAVVARPDPVMGQVGVAVVVPAVGRPVPTLAALRAFLAPHLARDKLPEGVVAVDALPLTAMDKLDRRHLAALVAAAVAATGAGGAGAQADGSRPTIDTKLTISPG